jgi:hypothetical protein
MIYTDIEALAVAVLQIDLSDDDQVNKLRRLVQIYWDARHNPPEGVIGVGAITYAQDALIAAQLNQEIANA